MAQLLEAAAPAEFIGDFSTFRSVYKRHTPFALDYVEQRVEGSQPATIEFTRGGDILFYVYLYTPNVVNWQSVLTSIDLLIGEQVIDTLPIEYIVEYWPMLSANTKSVANYQNAFFLPVPIPKIPLCALRFQTVKLRLNGLRTVVPKCQACYAYLGEERTQFTDFDMLIDQVQKKPVCTDGSVHLSNPVKYLWSNSITTDRVLLDGADVWTVDPAIGLYYSTSYGENRGFISADSYIYYDVSKWIQNVTSLTTAKNNVYMVSQANVIVYNFGPMNSSDSWSVIPLP